MKPSVTSSARWRGCEQAAPAAGQGDGCASAQLEALIGLGKVHFLVGRFIEAEGWMRKAISLGQELGLTPVQLARLYFWVCDSLYWQSRYAEMTTLAEEGLVLLGGAIESVEAATMIFCFQSAYAMPAQRRALGNISPVSAGFSSVCRIARNCGSLSGSRRTLLLSG